MASLVNAAHPLHPLPTLPAVPSFWRSAPVLAAIILACLTLPWLNPFSPGPTPSVGPLLFSWACAVLAAWAMTHHPAPATLVRGVVLAWLAGSGLNALIGLLQYFGASGWAGMWLNHASVGTAFGHLRQRNQFATLMAIGLAATLWWAAQRATPPGLPTAQPGDKPQAWHHQTWLPVSMALLLGVGNAASSSRTGLLQWGVLVLLTLWWHPPKLTHLRQPWPRLWWVLLAALLGYGVAMVALPVLAGLDPSTNGAWARLRSGDGPCNSRLTLWGNVLHLIGQKPWLGWGWGELSQAHFTTLFPGTRFCEILDNAHNLPLHLAVELGVPATAILCAGGLWWVWRRQPWHSTQPSHQLAWCVLAVVGLHSLLEYPLWYGPFQMAALLSLGLLWRPAGQGQPNPQITTLFSPLTHRFIAFTAITSIAICAWSGWNYLVVSQIYMSPGQRMAAYRDHTQEKVNHVWLFQDQARFAALTTTPLTKDNATAVHAMALDLLRFSPETRVVERVIDSAELLGLNDEVAFYSRRFAAAFPAAHARWLAQKTLPATASASESDQ